MYIMIKVYAFYIRDDNSHTFAKRIFVNDSLFYVESFTVKNGVFFIIVFTEIKNTNVVFALIVQ